MRQRRKEWLESAKVPEIDYRASELELFCCGSLLSTPTKPDRKEELRRKYKKNHHLPFDIISVKTGRKH